MYVFAGDTEQNFYLVVDPDGRVRTIKGPEKKTAPAQAAQKSEKKEDKADDGVVESIKKLTPTPIKAGEDKEPPSLLMPPALQKASSGKVKKDPLYAPYNGADYLDSEVLDAATQNQRKKNYFYIINDGVGNRVAQQDSEFSSPIAEDEATIVARSQVFTTLPNEFTQISNEVDIKNLLGAVVCLSADRLKKPESVSSNEWSMVYIDQSALRFAGALGVLAVYKVGGDGLRSIVARSFARSTKQPAFSRPYLAFAGSDGCISRVLTAYFQREYAGTQTQYPKLEAEVSVHAEEKYFVVLVPGKKSVAAPVSYQLSPYGQFGIKWQP
jgi:hypothetical protein